MAGEAIGGMVTGTSAQGDGPIRISDDGVAIDRAQLIGQRLPDSDGQLRADFDNLHRASDRYTRKYTGTPAGARSFLRLDWRCSLP